jgi:type IV secretory pathway ATPase VirB11/archaellum biosynthesis ATPase
LQLADVVKIKAFRTTSVRITTREGEQYIFKSLSDRELVVALLLQLKQKTRSENEPMLTDSTLSQSDADNSRLDVSLEDPPSEQHASEKVMEQSSSALEPSSVEKEMEIEASSDADSVQSDRCVVTPYVDPQDAWDKAKNGNDPPYSETALEVSMMYYWTRELNWDLSRAQRSRFICIGTLVDVHSG